MVRDMVHKSKPKKRPTAVSLVLGTHDIKIYMIRANEYIVINKLKTEKT